VGRKRKPKELHDLHGNPGHRQQPAGPGPGTRRTTCPSWLSDTARQEWRRLAAELEATNRLTNADRAAFAGRCAAYDLAMWAYRSLHQVEVRVGDQRNLFKSDVPELTVDSLQGGLRPRPEISIFLKALDTMRRFDSEFGLTPASRGNIPKVAEPETEKEQLAASLFGPPKKRSEDEEDDEAARKVVQFSKN
jgi:P27 family predicted phage terminase small subunit